MSVVALMFLDLNKLRLARESQAFSIYVVFITTFTAIILQTCILSLGFQSRFNKLTAVQNLIEMQAVVLP